MDKYMTVRIKLCSSFVCFWVFVFWIQLIAVLVVSPWVYVENIALVTCMIYALSIDLEQLARTEINMTDLLVRSLPA